MERRHNSNTLSPSNSMLVPDVRRQLAVEPPITSNTALKIPAGWGIEQVPRPDGSQTDMYYYEPGTGRRFRSIREVDRYLSGEEKRYQIRRSTRISTNYRNSEYRRMPFSSHRDRRNSEHQKMIVPGRKLSRMDELSQSNLGIAPCGQSASMASFNLPDGWIVEEMPRRKKSLTDKYYYEPETGRKFKSLVSVQRHLEELEENAPLSKAFEEIKENKPLSKIFKLENRIEISKKRVSKEIAQASSLPTKVKWVIASPQGDAWNPFISDTLVSDAVKQQWTNRFMLFIKDGKH